jgi:microcystin-dependent protein
LLPQPGNVGIYDEFLGHIEITAAPTGEFDRRPSVNGQIVSRNQNVALYQVIGDTYGGNGFTNFGLPDLRGRVPIGAGAGPGLTDRPLASSLGEPSHTLTPDELPAHTHALPGGGFTDPVGGGQPHENMQPSLALNYIIALNGLVPSATASNDGFAIMGEVSLFAGNFAPAGWAIAAGQILPISAYPDLYNVLGVTYGGDGVNTFALPDLRGRSIIHATGNDYQLGDVVGEEQHTLLESEMATHMHSVVPEPAAGIVCVLGALMTTTRRTRQRDGKKTTSVNAGSKAWHGSFTSSN